MASLNPFSLRKQLAFYGAYHTDHINVLIHMLGVPSIIFSVCVFLSSYGSLHPSLQRHAPLLASYLTALGSHLSSHLPASLFQHARLDPSALFMSTYLGYYTVLDPLAALLYSPAWYALYYSATAFLQTHPADALRIAAAVFTAGWIAQFYGHGVHERRAPALLDNLLGAVVLAPFFVWLEVLFLLGYRRQLQRELRSDVGVLVAEFRREKGGKAKKA